MPTSVIVVFYVFLIALQYLCGNVDVSLFAFPVNVILLIAVLSFSTFFSLRFANNRVMRSLRSLACARILILLLALQTVAGGLMPQHASFQTSLPFVFTLSFLILNLWLCILHRIRSFRLSCDTSFVILHSGLLLLLVGGFAGAPDVRKSTVSVSRHYPERMSVDDCGNVVVLPFTLQLYDFDIATDTLSGAPSCYIAFVAIKDSKTTETHIGKVETNKPLSLSWSDTVCLIDYDMSETDIVARCTLLVVHQPWRYMMTAGIIVFVAGLLFLLFDAGRKRLKEDTL